MLYRNTKYHCAPLFLMPEPVLQQPDGTERDPAGDLGDLGLRALDEEAALPDADQHLLLQEGPLVTNLEKRGLRIEKKEDS